jgi:hypothetical protein
VSDAFRKLAADLAAAQAELSADVQALLREADHFAALRVSAIGDETEPQRVDRVARLLNDAFGRFGAAASRLQGRIYAHQQSDTLGAELLDVRRHIKKAERPTTE